MHIISMLLFPALFLASLGVLCGASTYERKDPATGRTLTCDMCPAGTHMAAHCTASKPTQCSPCKWGHFTELENYLSRCLYCNNFCSENQEVEKECSATSNRVCRCKEGLYWVDGFCIRHTQCEAGYGVQTKGSSKNNTVCEICADGYFSNTSSAVDSCIPHRECASGQIVLLAGTIDHDAVCGTCQDIANGGETFRIFLSEFLGTHRMRVAKMKNFVSRYIQKSREARGRRTTAKQRGPLLGQIKAWLTTATKEELEKLPEMLRATQLKTVADNLEMRLREIRQQSSSCSESV
ncbi:uncharacterized protein V6R79_024412 [Siganus canaliculatus]